MTDAWATRDLHDPENLHVTMSPGKKWHHIGILCAHFDGYMLGDAASFSANACEIKEVTWNNIGLLAVACTKIM